MAAPGPGSRGPGVTDASSPGRSSVRAVTLGIVLGGLVVTGVLTGVTLTQYNDNEQHILQLRARDAGATVSAAVTGIETPLASAAELADATGGDPAQFKQFMAPYVGTGKQYVSASLWPLSPPGRGPVVVDGSLPVLEPGTAATEALFARVASRPGLAVKGFLHGPGPPVLGYAISGFGSGNYAVFAESKLSSRRAPPPPSSSPFAGFEYAIYLGKDQRPADLISADVALPITGQQAAVSVPFGNDAFTLVMSPRTTLEGELPERLPLIVAVLGLLLTLFAATVAERLVRRRAAAEELAVELDHLAAENQRLFAEQRGVAVALQQALLPERLPAMAGLETSLCYRPGVEGLEIGGDWYDFILIDDRRAMMVVGDVSGRGVRAATVMASLRYAIRAFVSEGHDPAAILSRLSNLVSVESDAHFATVLCGLIDVDAHTVTLANAGHLPPLLIDGGRASLIDTPVGVPVGVAHPASYQSVTVTVPARATVLAVTDGLVERRGESIDVGLERLRTMATAPSPSLDSLLTSLADGLTPGGSADDTALLGVRWRM